MSQAVPPYSGGRLSRDTNSWSRGRDSAGLRICSAVVQGWGGWGERGKSDCKRMNWRVEEGKEGGKG